LATIAEDVLHVHSGHDGSHSPLLLLSVVREPELQSAGVLAGAQLCGGKGDTSSLPDPCRHRPLMVLHQENLMKVGLLRLLAGVQQLLLQSW